MFINKINGISNLGFKGYQHIKNDNGESVFKFNYPYDSEKETCMIEIYKAVPNEKYNYKLSETPIKTIELKPNGVDVNLNSIPELGKNDAFAYKVIRKDKTTGEVVYSGADTGVKMQKSGDEYVFQLKQDKASASVKGENNREYGYELLRYGDKDYEGNFQYTLVSRKGTTPTIQGPAYLIMPDAYKPGYKYKGFNDEETGSFYYDKEHQLKSENVVKSFSNRYEGNLAGIEASIPELAKKGYKRLFLTPVANGDDVSSHSYWNKNNFQVASTMGNAENLASVMRNAFKNGMNLVNDDTLTSEGLEGIHFQYALRWAEKNPQTYYWFRMNSIKNTNLGLGVLPDKMDTVSHRVVNAPYNYEKQADGTYKAVGNPEYKADKPTYVQIYDKTQVSENQEKALDKVIRVYDSLVSGNELDKIDYRDTLMAYTFQIDPKEYSNRIKIVNELNSKFDKNLDIKSAMGTVVACDFSNFRFTKNSEGMGTWDANNDMVKLNYQVSGFDEKQLQAIKDPAERDHERKMIIRGTKEVQDMALQVGRYWTGKNKDILILYIAQTLGNAKTVNDIKKLVEKGELPKEALVSETEISNILNGQYQLAPKGMMDKNDITVKALMKMPLDALELGEDTVGVLSTSYFSNRATSDETLGMTRFELMKQKNPHLVEPYAKNYEKINDLFSGELKDFADDVIKSVNASSNEPLIDKNGDYTEYGEYIIDLIGADITKYAMLKAIGGESFEAKIMPDSNDMTYNYEKLKNATSLKTLGINAHAPAEEAAELTSKIRRGLKSLGAEDAKILADSISKRIAGTDTSSFRLAEAMFNKSGLGLDHRLDAAKDVMDIDEVRNKGYDVNDATEDLINFWSRFVNTVKQENPNSYIVAEVTDIPDLVRETIGTDVYPNDGRTDLASKKFNGEPDLMSKFYNETGINSEAGYSYFYTDLLANFSRAFEEGHVSCNTHDAFKNRFDLLIRTRGIDFIRNLYNFIDNHDKPRMIGCMALDLDLFYNTGDKTNNMRQALQLLSGSKSKVDMPVEFLFVDGEHNDYQRTIGTRAVAMSKLLSDVLNDDLKDAISEEDRKDISSALVDLANGNYLVDANNVNYRAINIKELDSTANALNAMLDMAVTHGLNISEDERKNLISEILKKAETMDLSKYAVHGDLDWAYGLSDDQRKSNTEAAKDFFGSERDFSNYSLITVQLARFLRDAYVETGLKPEAKEAIVAGMKDFTEKFNRQLLRDNTIELPKMEEAIISKNKNGYAARDLRVAIKMAIKQAEFKTGRQIANKEEIADKVFKYATEPAVAKANMIMEYMSALCGNNTVYAGDEVGQTGYEEKAKNTYLQNRNAYPEEQLKSDSTIGKYRRSIEKGTTDTLKKRAKLHSLNDGTPYALDVMANGYTRDELRKRIAELNMSIDNAKDENEKAKFEEERRMLTKDLAKIAHLSQSANGDMTVSLFYAGDVELGNRVDYFAKYGLKTEDDRKKFFEENNINSIDKKNKYVPIQEKTEMDAIMLGGAIALPIGTIFMNANSKDKATYVVKEIAGKLGIAREDGGKIVMDGMTSKNGVMILKSIAKKLSFKGKQPYYNKQYNIVSNPYGQKDLPQEGQKLSIISR